MTRRDTILAYSSGLLVALSTLATGCLDTDAKRGLAFSCTSDGDCLDGYYCNPNARCVEGIPSADADTGDTDADMGDAEADTGDAEADTGDAEADATLPVLGCYPAPPPTYACSRPDSMLRITTEGNNTHPVLSSNGRDVVWISSGALVESDDDGGELDVYWRVVDGGVINLAADTPAGEHATDLSVVPGEIVWIGTTTPGSDPAGVLRYANLNDSGVLGVAGGQARYPTRAGTCYAFVTTESLDVTDTNGDRDFYLAAPDQVVPINMRPGVQGPLGMTTSAEPGQVALDAPALVYAAPHSPNGAGLDDVIYVDLETGVESLLSADMQGEPGRQGVSRFPKVSHDGTAAVFWTTASHLLGGSGLDTGALVVVDTPRASTSTPTLTVIWDYGIDERPGDHAISGDGRYVVFSSSEQIDGATNTMDATQVWAYDREHDAFALVTRSGSVGSVGGNGHSFDVALDGSGCRVAFATEADNLAAAPNGEGSDIVVAPMPAPPDPDRGEWGVWTPHPGR